MKSIMGLHNGETYAVEYFDFCNGWVLSINGIEQLNVPVYNSKSEAEQAACKHFNENNWTREDELEQAYFDRWEYSQ